MKPHPCSIEPLESRIAPANFFASGAALTIENAGGVSVNRPADALLVGATGAVLLNAGDSLIYDLDGDGTFEPFNPLVPDDPNARDVRLVQVTGGRAIVFLRNFNADGGYDPDEISGLALGNGFRGVVNTDVRGDIATVLNPAGTLSLVPGTATIQFASIAGLNIAGRVADDILAGNQISKVTIGGGLYLAGPASSVGTIGTGSESDGITIHFGTVNFTTDFTQPAAVAGGNITDVKLANGANRIAAGDGGDNAAGNGAAGGSISRVNTGAAREASSVLAGDGGNALGAGRGGAGGNIVACMITAANPGASNVYVIAGTGGDATVAGDGGKGGSIMNTSLRVDGTGTDVFFNASDGGAATGMRGVGGNGGTIVNSSVIASGHLAGGLTLVGGGGGSASDDQASGGVGGAVSKLTVRVGTAADRIIISSGHGGDGRLAGAGNQLQGLTFTAESIGEDLILSAGDGGNGIVDAGSRGGRGGSVTGLDARVGTVDAGPLSRVLVFGGDGGEGRNAPGGDGGAVSKSRVLNTGMIGSSGLWVSAGDGGEVMTGNGTGGAGGPMSDVSVTNFGGLSALKVESGDGGAGLGRGNGGVSGRLSGVTLQNYAEIDDPYATIASGNGGMAGVVSGNGGHSGAVGKVVIRDTFDATAIFRLTSGIAGGSAEGRSGNSGAISGVTLDGFGSSFEIVAGGLGVALADNPLGGGSGGGVSKVSGVVGQLVVRAGNGLPSTLGAGGTGGSISNVNITAVGEFVRTLMAGSGGAGATRGGAGGSVSTATVAGDIGDFSDDFEMTASGTTGQGGISVGQGGTGATPGLNGSVRSVTAHGIASIVAGRPAANAITAANAVFAISGVRAVVAGADTDADESFLFINAGPAGFHLGDGDTALDGLVVVRAAGFQPIRNPLTNDPVAPLDIETV